MHLISPTPPFVSFQKRKHCIWKRKAWFHTITTNITLFFYYIKKEARCTKLQVCTGFEEGPEHKCLLYVVLLRIPARGRTCDLRDVRQQLSSYSRYSFVDCKDKHWMQHSTGVGFWLNQRIGHSLVTLQKFLQFNVSCFLCK